MNNTTENSEQYFPHSKLSIAYDFSKRLIINTKEGLHEVELVEFTNPAREKAPYRNKIQLGSFLPETTVREILGREKNDPSVYHVLNQITKTTREEQELTKDFGLLEDFFLQTLVREVKNLVDRKLAKIKEQFSEESPATNFTPRHRRTMLLAIFKVSSLKNGRKFTQHLLDEINKRFAYKRVIKMKHNQRITYFMEYFEWCVSI